MKVYLSDHHTLTTICGVPYLLPYGQGIVDYEGQLKLNSSAAALWDRIAGLLSCDGMDRDLLAERLCEADADGDVMPTSDAREFIDSLIFAGALTV